jgi:hypothetical protein
MSPVSKIGAAEQEILQRPMPIRVGDLFLALFWFWDTYMAFWHVVIHLNPKNPVRKPLTNLFLEFFIAFYR